MPLLGTGLQGSAWLDAVGGCAVHQRSQAHFSAALQLGRAWISFWPADSEQKCQSAGANAEKGGEFSMHSSQVVPTEAPLLLGLPPQRLVAESYSDWV